MAEIWYLGVGTGSLEGLQARHEKPLGECIELLEITPEKWVSPPDAIPDLTTGNPLIDDSGYVYVMMRAGEGELAGYGDKGWKPGWYKSHLTIVGFEKNLRKKPK